MLLAGRDVVGDHATPEFALLESFDVEACDDAEVVRAAFERAEEIRVGGSIDVDDLAVGENEFVVDDIVADETVAWTEERDASYDWSLKSAKRTFSSRCFQNQIQGSPLESPFQMKKTRGEIFSFQKENYQGRKTKLESLEDTRSSSITERLDRDNQDFYCSGSESLYRVLLEPDICSEEN